MGFFSGLEGGLEKYIEGFFKDRFKGALQPVDIAKALAREMRNQRRIGLNEIYAPNYFNVYLSPADLSGLTHLMEKLAQEMAKYIADIAAEKEYTLLGAISINFQGDQEIAAGAVKVEGFFDETIKNDALPDIHEDTLRFKPVKNLIAGDDVAAEHAPLNARLEVLDGFLQGRQFILKGNMAIIGRRDICAVYLPDNSVSRRHAAVIRSEEGYLIKDYDSTNGTYVNGKQILQSQLKPGDKVKVGRVVLGFKVE